MTVATVTAVVVVMVVVVPAAASTIQRLPRQSGHTGGAVRVGRVVRVVPGRIRQAMPSRLANNLGGEAHGCVLFLCSFPYFSRPSGICFFDF